MSEQTWFIARHGKTVGPLSKEDVAEGLRSRVFRWLDQACLIETARPGLREWKLLQEFTEDFQAMVSDDHDLSIRESAGDRPWVLAKGGESRLGGPYSLRELAQALSLGEISFRDLVWRDGFAAWRILADCEEFTRENLQRALALSALSGENVEPTTQKLEEILQIEEEVEEFAFQTSNEVLRAVVRQPPMTSAGYAKWAVDLDRPDDAVGEDLLETPSWMRVLTPLFFAAIFLGLAEAPRASASEALTLAPNADGSFIAVQLAADAEVSGAVSIRFFAPAGHVVKGLSCERTTKVSVAPGESKSLSLAAGDLDLPPGDYQVDAEVRGLKAHAEIQFGARGEDYEKKLEAHLKASSEELEKQRKVLYYSALALSHLVDDLAQHDKDASPTSYFDSSSKKTQLILKKLASGSVSEAGEVAYPREVQKLRVQAKAILGDLLILKKERSKRAVASAEPAAIAPRAQQAVDEIDHRRKICKDLLTHVGELSDR